MRYEDVMKQKKGFRIERVDTAKGELTIIVSDDWIDTVCSAVEKQIPQKVKEYEDKYYSCPICGNVLMRKWLKYPDELYPKSDVSPYCLSCGQRLDWSDDDD